MPASARKNKLPFLRVEVTIDRCCDNAANRRTAAALGVFFAQASSVLHKQCKLVTVDPAQLFHEKTGYFHPRYLPDQLQAWPPKARHLVAEMRKNHYEVTELGALEKRYQTGLRHLVFEIETKEGGAFLQEQNIRDPKDISTPQLQFLFNKHLRYMPKESPYRELESFKDYAALRADCGERAVAQYLQGNDPARRAETVLHIFVSNDKEALEGVREAYGAIERRCHFQGHTVHEKDFPHFAEKFVKAVKSQYPECADIPFNRPLSHAEALEARRAAAKTQQSR